MYIILESVLSTEQNRIKSTLLFPDLYSPKFLTTVYTHS